jgi:hypothetical protein
MQDDNTPPPKKTPNTTIKKQHKAKKMRNIESTKQPEVTHVNSTSIMSSLKHITAVPGVQQE